MAKSRLELHSLLTELLISVDPEYEYGHCFFREPSKMMKYPCIIYKHTSNSDRFADNTKYIKYGRYTITVIDENPDSILKEKMDELTFTHFDREYESDGLNHFVYNMFF